MIEQLSGLLVPGIIGLLTGGAFLMRRFSHDKLEMVKDRAEEGVIEHLIRQRDDALKDVSAMKAEVVEIASENEEAIENIRQLTSQNEQMKSQIRMLNILVKRLAAMNNMTIDPIEAPQ